MAKSAGVWEVWLDGAVQALEESVLLRSLRPLVVPPLPLEEEETFALGSEVQTFEGLGPWDRAGVEVEVSHATFQSWITDCSSTGEYCAVLDSILFDFGFTVLFGVVFRFACIVCKRLLVVLEVACNDGVVKLLGAVIAISIEK